MSYYFRILLISFCFLFLKQSVFAEDTVADLAGETIPGTAVILSPIPLKSKLSACVGNLVKTKVNTPSEHNFFDQRIEIVDTLFFRARLDYIGGIIVESGPTFLYLETKRIASGVYEKIKYYVVFRAKKWKTNELPNGVPKRDQAHPVFMVSSKNMKSNAYLFKETFNEKDRPKAIENMGNLNLSDCLNELTNLEEIIKDVL